MSNYTPKCWWIFWKQQRKKGLACPKHHTYFLFSRVTTNYERNDSDWIRLCHYAETFNIYCIWHKLDISSVRNQKASPMRRWWLQWVKHSITLSLVLFKALGKESKLGLFPYKLHCFLTKSSLSFKAEVGNSDLWVVDLKQQWIFNMFVSCYKKFESKWKFLCIFL